MQNLSDNDSAEYNGGAANVKPTSTVLIGLAWLLVSTPLLWGVFETFRKALALFQ